MRSASGQGGRRVGRAARPGRVEHRPRARQIAADGDPAAHLDDRRVAARPGRQMPKCPSARGEQSDPQLFVGGPAGAEDRDAGLRVGLDHAHLVGAPVADRPQRIGVAPQEVGTHRVHASRRRFRSPPPTRSRRRPRRCCSIPPTTASTPPQAVDNQCTVRTRSPCCHEGSAPEGRWSRSRCAPERAPVNARVTPREDELGRRARNRHEGVRRECAPDTLPKNA